MPVKDEELLFIDADTLLDEKGGRHRLLGADTNETVHPTKPETIQGHIQKAAMMEFAQGAHLEPSGIDDIYGRNLSNLKRDDGTNVMEQFVEAGMVPASYGSSKEMQAASTRAIYREALGVSNPQLEGFRQLSEYYKKKNPLKPIIKDTFRSDGSFKRSMRRGADNMQASLYSFTNVMGQLFGSDTVKEWSDKGIERNLEEAMVNPPKIENYQHVKSFDALGTYIVETFGEQIPNLLTMIGSGGAALLGKAAAQQLGKGALARVAANTSRSNAILAGTAGVNFPQLTGEANNELRKHGIEAPGTVLATGLLDTVLETYGLSKLLEKYLNAYKASGKGMGDLLKSVGVATGSQFAVEGATEMSQTFTNKLAVAAHKDDYDILSDDNLVEMIDAGLRGGLVGAGMGGSASFAGGVANRLKPEGTDPKTPNDGGPDGFSLEQQPWEQQSLVGPEPQNLDQEESFDNPNQMGFDLEDPNAPKQEWYRGYIDPTKEFNANSMTSGRLDNSGQTPEITGVDFSQYSTDSLMNAFNAEQPDYNTLGPYEAEAYDVNYEALTAELERRDAFNEFEYYENDSNISPSVVPTFPEPGPTLSADVKGEVDPAEGEPAETMDSILGVPADYLFPDQVEAMPPTLNHKEGKDGTRSVEVKDEKEQDSIVNHEVITVVLPTFPESGPTLSADHLNEVITVVLPTSPEPGPTLSADVKDEKEQDSIPTQPVYNTVGQTDKITDKTTNDAFKNNKAITPELSKRIVEGLRKFVSDMEAENDTTPPRREDYESKEAFRRDFKAHRLDTQLYRTVKNILKNTKKGLVSALMGSSKKGDIAALLRKINEDPTTNSYGFNESFEELKDSQLDFGQTDMFPQKHEETKNTKKGGKKKTDHKGTLSVNRKPGRKPRAFDPTSISPSGQDKNLVGKSEERDVNELLGIAKNIAEERGRKVEEANVPKRSSTRSPFDADDIVNSDAPVFENIDDDAITDSQDDDTRDFRTSATREESDVYLGRQMVKYESLNKLSREEKAKLDTSESEDKMGRLRRHKLNHGEIGSLSNKDAKVKGFANREAAEKFAKEQIREGKNYPEYADLKDDPDAIRVIKKKGRYFIKISPRPEMFSSGTKISAFDVRMDDNDLFRVAIKKAHNSYKSLKQAIKTLNKSQTRDDISPGYSGRGLLKTKVGYIQLPYLVSLMRSYKQTTTKENMSERDKQKEDVTNTLSALWATDILPAKEKAKIFSHQSKDGLTPYGRSLQVGFHKGKVRTMGDYTGQGRMNHVERNMSLSKGERAELAAGKKPREGYVRGIDEDILSANEAKLLKATNKIAANPGGELSVDEVSLAIYKAIESYLRGTGRLENVNQHTDISKLPFRDDGQSSETIGQRIKRAFKYVENRGFDSDALKKVKDIYEGPNLRLIENLTEKDMARLHRSLVEDEVGAYLQEEILPLSTEVGLPHKAKQKGIADREMEALQTRKRNALRTKAGAKIKKARDRIEDTETVDPSTKETVSEEEMEAIKRSNGDSQTVYDLTRKSDKIQTDRERLEEAEERAAKTEAHRVEDEGNLKRIMKGITGRQNLTISDKGFSPRDKNFLRVALESVPELKKIKLLVVTKSDFMGSSYFKDHKFTPMAIKRARKFLKDNPEVRGQTIPVGDSAIVIVDDIHTPATNQASGERLLVLGHELGHIVFNQIKNNMTSGQQARLTKMHRDSKTDLDQEEWFSDQVSALIKDRTAKTPKGGIIEEAAQKIMDSLNKLWNALSKAMSRRFTLDENFDKWMTRSVLPKSDMFSNNIGYDYTREFTMEKPKRIAGKAYRTLKKVFTKDLAPMYLTAHRQLLNMGPAGEKLARMFHVENATAAERLGWMDVKDTESAYRSKRFMDLLPEDHAGFLQEYTDMITAKEESLTDDFRDTVFMQYQGIANETVYGLDLLKQFAKSSNGDRRTALVEMIYQATPGRNHAEKVAFAKEYLSVPEKFQALDNEMRSHYQYLNKNMGGKMARMQYFFPRMYDVNALMENKKGFIDILTSNSYVLVNKEGDKEYIDNTKAEAIWKALTSNEGMDADGFFVDQGLKTPSLDNKKHRTLRDIPDNVLREFLVQDDIRLMKYISASTKRAEYESRAGGRTNVHQLFTKMKKQIAQGREIDPEIYARVAELAKDDQRAWDKYEKAKEEGKNVAPPKRKQYWDPNHKVDGLIQGLPEEDRARARLIMDSYLGRLGLDMNPTMDKIQQVFAAVQLTTTLLFATLASLQDPAGIAIKTGEWKSLPKIAGHMYKAVKNKAEYDQMARTIGVVQDETVGKILAELYGMNYIDPKIQKVTDAYFKYTGLEWFTKMTRTVGVAMGKDFIRDHMSRIIADGNKTSVDYMQRLGLDTENPRIPTDQDFLDDDAFRQGVSKFVDDSILRPNAAQRPAWGSDKRFLLLWQLKSFFYGFGHTILSGMFREAKRIHGNEQGMQKFKAAFPFILGAATLIPIAMLGLELREIVKYGFNPAPTDRMDTDTYFAEIFERAGGLGPMTLATGMFSASEFNGSPVNALLGPTAQHVELLMKDFGAGLERAIPVHSQLKDRMFGFDYNPLR